MIELNKYLSHKDFIKIVNQNAPFCISKEVQEEVEKSHEFLTAFAKNKVIYGINTGFGPMAQYRVSDENILQLQYNLIRSHASGSGNPIPSIHVRAAMLARLNSICQAKSGVHPSVIRVLTELLNKEVYPLIFEHGGVGASGDLVQLSHLALILIGEGEVFYKGKRVPTKAVFNELNIRPIDVKIREGLSLINGTSVMTGIGLHNHFLASKLLDWSVSFSCMINELVRAYDDHFSAPLNEAKLHQGQRTIAERMRAHLIDSQLVKKREHDLYSGSNKEKLFKEKVQEYYSIRCIPQILGPISDTLIYTQHVLENELNSANDNPIIDAERNSVFHGGNFHGDYISLEMDKMKLGITRISMLAERQLNFLLNAKINEILPPFVTRGTLGLNYGVQGAQFTATSTTAENQTLSNSMYVHSIPNNNDNQDIVSMGTNAAQMTHRVIMNTFEVMSIEVLAIFQAIRYLKIENKLSTKSKQTMEALSGIIPDMIADEIVYPITHKVKEYLLNN